MFDEHFYNVFHFFAFMFAPISNSIVQHHIILLLSLLMLFLLLLLLLLVLLSLLFHLSLIVYSQVEHCSITFSSACMCVCLNSLLSIVYRILAAFDGWCIVQLKSGFIKFKNQLTWLLDFFRVEDVPRIKNYMYVSPDVSWSLDQTFFCVPIKSSTKYRRTKCV